jgi:hypothetical protein
MSIDIYWRLPTHGCHHSIRHGSYDRGDWSPPRPTGWPPGWMHRGRRMPIVTSTIWPRSPEQPKAWAFWVASSPPSRRPTTPG